MDYTPPPRLGAFRAAGRHTAQVRFLRRAILLVAVLGVSVIAIVAVFDPFRHLPKGVSIGGVGVKGTKVTMDSPKISGVQQGGGPYDIAAKTGIQDITTPSVIELLGVDAHVGMADATTTHVLSRHGVYDSKDDTMALDGDVTIANSSGYSFGLKSAMIDFKKGILASEERMRVDLKGGFVFSDAMTISNNGHAIAFRGHVASTFDPPEDDSDAAVVAVAPGTSP
jgi:lipopolysaccharide export system protein LptC